MPIHFSIENTDFSLKQKSKLKAWIEKVIIQEKKTLGEISYLFTNDEAVLTINKEYLKHNTYTDIITFDYCEKKTMRGDIFISIDRVKYNAEKFNVKFEEELKRVMIHGVLHLCGYKDKTDSDSQKMRKKEDKALLLFKTL